MKKFFAVLIALFFLGITQAKADIMPFPTPSEPTKEVFGCVFYKDFEKNPNLFLVDTSEQMLILSEKCNQPGQSIKVFDRRIIDPSFILQSVVYSDSLSLPTSLPGSNNDLSFLFDNVIKKDAPIKSIDQVVIFDSYSTSTLDTDPESFFRRSVKMVVSRSGSITSSYVPLALAKKNLLRGYDDEENQVTQVEFDYGSFNIKTQQKFVVNWADGKITELDKEGFNKLLQDYAPNYVEHRGLQISNQEDWGYLIFNTWRDVFREIYGWIFLLATILVEGLVFWFFGSRKLFNYVYLVIVNFLSFNIGVTLLGVLIQLNVLSLSGDINAFVTYFFVEGLVILIEFILFLLFFYKKYSVKEILFFTVLANTITALLGIVFVLLFSFFS